MAGLRRYGQQCHTHNNESRPFADNANTAANHATVTNPAAVSTAAGANPGAAHYRFAGADQRHSGSTPQRCTAAV